VIHHHVWKIIDQVEQPSAAEMAKEIKARNARADDLFVRPVIVSYRCERCGTEKVERV
jgi:hypothetical protein